MISCRKGKRVRERGRDLLVKKKSYIVRVISVKITKSGLVVLPNLARDSVKKPKERTVFPSRFFLPSFLQNFPPEKARNLPREPFLTASLSPDFFPSSSLLPSILPSTTTHRPSPFLLLLLSPSFCSSPFILLHFHSSFPISCHPSLATFIYRKIPGCILCMDFGIGYPL